MTLKQLLADLPRIVADARQAIAISISVLGTAIGEHVFHGTWPSTAVGVLGLIGGALAAWKINPPQAVAKRTLAHPQ